MAEQIPGNLGQTTIAVGGYTAGAATINVVSTALPFPASGTFSVVVYDQATPPAPRGIKRVSAVNSATQWAVSSEGADFNANAGDKVYPVFSEAGLPALLGYRVAEDEGTPVVQRPTLNFAGAGVSVADTGGKTVVTIPGGGGGSGNAITYGTYAALPASAATAGDMYVQTDGPYTFIWSGAAWVAFLPGFGPVTIPVSGDYTQVNFGGSSVDATFGALDFSAPAGSASWNVRQLLRAIPAAPYTWRALVSPGPKATQRCGITLKNAAGGGLVMFEILSTSSSSLNFNSSNMTSATVASGVNFAPRGYAVGSSGVWMGIRDDNTNRHFETSADGRVWYPLHSESRTDFITPDQIGFFHNTDNSLAQTMRIVHVEIG